MKRSEEVIKKWEQFVKEHLEFPLNKYLSILKLELENNIKEGNQIFNIENFQGSNININIEYFNENAGNRQKYRGYTDTINAIENKFEFFNIYITIIDIQIDYKELLSVIQHEIKHVYDMLDNSKLTNTFLKDEPINKLKRKYVNSNNDFYYFIHLVYECLRHELDARNAMIYDRFRWLKNYDKSEIMKEFKNTYMYKSLMNLENFNSIQFISKFKEFELINITNDFVLIYGEKSTNKINDKNDLVKFYKYWEDIFKKESKEYLKKAEKVIDELIEDNRPYVESINREYMGYPYIDELKEMFLFHLNKIFLQ